MKDLRYILVESTTFRRERLSRVELQIRFGSRAAVASESRRQTSRASGRRCHCVLPLLWKRTTPMRIATHGWLVRGLSSLIFLGLLTPLVSLSTAMADVLPQFAGYTRPGSPDGPKTIFVGNEEAKKKAIGGTVYYMVLERAQGKEGDPWGTGVEDFIKAFRPGVEFNGAFSGGLDTSAKYLYLYQTVNDRGTLVPIQSTSVELLVDLKLNEITSWGYFASVGFGILDKEGGDRPAPTAIRPVSATPVVGADAKEPIYLRSAPAVPAPQPYR